MLKDVINNEQITAEEIREEIVALLTDLAIFDNGILSYYFNPSAPSEMSIQGSSKLRELCLQIENNIGNELYLYDDFFWAIVGTTPLDDSDSTLSEYINFIGGYPES